MLIRFKISNYLSINDEIEFSMLKGQTRNFPEQTIKTKNMTLVKAGVIYGANASGKSTLVKAIDFSKKIITRGVDNVSVLNKGFRLSKENKNRTRVEYEICIKDRYFAYGFILDIKGKIIIEEWLYELFKDNELKIFERNTLKNSITTQMKFKNDDSSNRFKIYSEDIRNLNNKLFLTELADKNIKKNKDFSTFIDVYEWFNKNLIIIYPESTYAGINFIESDEDLKELYSNMLDYFDTGIDGLKSIEIPFEELIKKYPNLPMESIEKDAFEKEMITINVDRNFYNIFRNKNGKIIVKMLGTIHKIKDFEERVFDFCDESDGTRRLFDLIPILNSIDDNERVFVIDEIDRSLHPNLTYTFIELFLRYTKSQLIVTTHDSNLLDQKLLRRDEIWFIEKRDKKQSKLYSLDEYKERYDKEIRNSYLNGRFGAVPNFKKNSLKKLGFKEWVE